MKPKLLKSFYLSILLSSSVFANNILLDSIKYSNKEELKDQINFLIEFTEKEQLAHDISKEENEILSNDNFYFVKIKNCLAKGEPNSKCLNLPMDIYASTNVLNVFDEEQYDNSLVLRKNRYEYLKYYDLLKVQKEDRKTAEKNEDYVKKLLDSEILCYVNASNYEELNSCKNNYKNNENVAVEYYEILDKMEAKKPEPPKKEPLICEKLDENGSPILDEKNQLIIEPDEEVCRLRLEEEEKRKQKPKKEEIKKEESAFKIK